MKETGFVYMLFNGEDLMYIGFTTDPMRRLKAHLSEATANSSLPRESRKLITTIKLAWAGTEDDGLCLEAVMIAKHNARFNQQNDNFREWMKDKYDERDYYWSVFSRRAFLNDPSVVFRCFHGEIEKAKRNDNYKAKCADLSHELSKTNAELSALKAEQAPMDILKGEIEFWRTCADTQTKISLNFARNASAWHDECMRVRRKLNQIPGVIQFYFGIKTAVRMVGCK